MKSGVYVLTNPPGKNAGFHHNRRIEDILEAINQIEKYATRGRQAFESDEMLQVWMVYHFQIIGEAANGLSPAIQDSTATIPWSDVIGMRNILIHRY